MRDLIVMGLQSNLVWKNPASNRKLFEVKILNNDEHPDLIILPETFTTGFPDFPDYLSEKNSGATLQWMADMAAKTGAVITGSLILENDNHVTNTLVWMRPDGNFDSYNKRHVFSMAGENEVIEGGREQLVVELNGWKIRPMICYDLRFPVWSKNKIDKAGNYEYDLAIYIANWPDVRTYAWSQLLVARAIENAAYVVGINRVGFDNSGKLFSGNSAIINPAGKVIEKAAEGKERALTAILSKTEIENFRNKFNVGRDWDEFELKL